MEHDFGVFGVFLGSEIDTFLSRGSPGRGVPPYDLISIYKSTIPVEGPGWPTYLGVIKRVKRHVRLEEDR